MKLNLKRKLLAVGALSLLGLGVGVSGAQAGTTYVDFSANLPNLQQGTNRAYQDKTTSNAYGEIRTSGVGSNYTVNAKMAKGSPPSYGTEVFGLGDNYYAQLHNSFKSGDRVSVRLTNSTWTTVTVEVAGRFRSN